MSEGPVLGAASAAVSMVGTLASRHPVAATAIGAGVAVAAAPALVASPLLAIAGFGSSGIVAGTTAATIQSSIGSVVAPSLFATLQSAGAGGYGAAAVYTAVQGAGATTAGAAVLAALRG
ncbi:hypothetical protein HJFPF1_02805 [Paramyrothecium foliicola]|nr:hypothetical protein HJFPF1_02805 [Paramyrothecium foliicola]